MTRLIIQSISMSIGIDNTLHFTSTDMPLPLHLDSARTARGTASAKRPPAAPGPTASDLGLRPHHRAIWRQGPKISPTSPVRLDALQPRRRLPTSAACSHWPRGDRPSV